MTQTVQREERTEIEDGRSRGQRTYLQMLKHGRLLAENRGVLPEIRVALLADHASQQLTLVLKSAIADRGFFPALYEADYGTAAAEAYDTDSGLYRFRPEMVIVSVAVQKYRERFLSAATSDARDALPEQYLAEVLGLADAIGASGARVIVSNFALPIERQFGNFGLMTRQSLYGSVLAFNAALAVALRTRGNCCINDVMYVASLVGTRQFFDERLWTGARYPCAPQSLPEIAASLANLIVTLKGRVTKCLILDLDNTLWGGVVGDDGIEGIRLGGDAHGESFAAFQRYLLSLQQRGYVLAVCSKNDESVALDAFRHHADMILKEEDIAVFVANWNDKASNIEYIARVLNIGLDACVFVDDSGFERQLVRTRLPAVAVPDMPEDVSDYVQTLESSGLLEATTYSAEDRQRSHLYRVEAQRSTAELKFSSIEDYLVSLEMRIECGPFMSGDLGRVAQLMQRSNQFNLRTRRLSLADCETAMRDTDDRFTLQARLADRYGDYGLIAAICCRIESQRLVVEELVMSCRVLKRGVDDFLVNALFAECRRRGLAGVQGEYIQTAKNSMVKDFYARYGFSAGAADGTRQSWFLPTANYVPRNTFIQGSHNE